MQEAQPYFIRDTVSNIGGVLLRPEFVNTMPNRLQFES